MLGISSLLEYLNTKKDLLWHLKTLRFCQWQKKDELNFTVTSSDDCSRGRNTTLPSQLAERACKISWQQSTSGFLVCYLKDATTVFSFCPTQQFPSILLIPQPSYSNYESSVFPHLWHHLPILPSVYQSLQQMIILFTELSLSIFTICPIHLIFYAFVYLTICARLVSKFICSLVLIFQLPKVGGYHAKFNLNPF